MENNVVLSISCFLQGINFIQLKFKGCKSQDLCARLTPSSVMLQMLGILADLKKILILGTEASNIHYGSL
jgi:hypothetical protein